MNTLSKVLYLTFFAIRNPEGFLSLAKFGCAKLRRNSGPFVRLPKPLDITLGNWVNFGEFNLWKKGLDSKELNALRIAIRKFSGDSFIALDIGANIGIFSLHLVAIGMEAVHAFEPIPETHSRLLKNLSLNPRLAKGVIPIQKGLSNVSGAETFVMNRQSPGTSKIAEAKDTHTAYKDCDRLLIHTTTVDDYCSSNGIAEIDFMKIDVEGFEPKILQGAVKMLERKAIRVVYTEVIEAALENAGFTADELVLFMEKFEYYPYSYSSATGFRQLSLKSICDNIELNRNVFWLNKISAALEGTSAKASSVPNSPRSI